jgi:hypothetical protein
MDHEEEKNQLTEEGVLIWREEGMAMAAVLAIIGRGGLLFVFREESLVCFFLGQNFVVFMSTKQTMENNNNNRNQMAYSLLKAITDAVCGSGIREDKEGWFHSIAGP